MVQAGAPVGRRRVSSEPLGGRLGEHLVEALTHDLVIDLAEVCRGFSIAELPPSEKASFALPAAQRDFTYLVTGAVQWAVNIVRLSVGLVHVPSAVSGPDGSSAAKRNWRRHRPS